ncbi:hypothetical protein JZ751_006633 [Albula glossodonta]|uniref:Uncharacterized protein n=1 Tax=Albula glossodonta TaxID=121402 RepID=A0A8T2P9M1_9TELE|nr:hypothetical protein JZ751_006633 [Albula glossodonta]
MNKKRLAIPETSVPHIPSACASRASVFVIGLLVTLVPAALVVMMGLADAGHSAKRPSKFPPSPAACALGTDATCPPTHSCISASQHKQEPHCLTKVKMTATRKGPTRPTDAATQAKAVQHRVKRLRLYRPPPITQANTRHHLSPGPKKSYFGLHPGPPKVFHLFPEGAIEGLVEVPVHSSESINPPLELPLLPFCWRAFRLKETTASNGQQRAWRRSTMDWSKCSDSRISLKARRTAASPLRARDSENSWHKNNYDTKRQLRVMKFKLHPWLPKALKKIAVIEGKSRSSSCELEF